MKENSATNPLHWGPRVLGLLYALFLSLFAFDSWEGVSSFWEGLVGFFIHLLPVYIILFLLVVGWRGVPDSGGGFHAGLRLAGSVDDPSAGRAAGAYRRPVSAG